MIKVVQHFYISWHNSGETCWISACISEIKNEGSKFLYVENKFLPCYSSVYFLNDSNDITFVFKNCFVYQDHVFQNKVHFSDRIRLKMFT